MLLAGDGEPGLARRTRREIPDRRPRRHRLRPGDWAGIRPGMPASSLAFLTPRDLDLATTATTPTTGLALRARQRTYMRWRERPETRRLQLTTITDETRLALANLVERATGIVTPSRPPRRHRPRPRRQDRVHLGARPQPDPRRPPAAVQGLCRAAASPAPGSSRSPTTPCRASTTSATSRRWSTSASGRTRPARSASSA